MLDSVPPWRVATVRRRRRGLRTFKTLRERIDADHQANVSRAAFWVRDTLAHCRAHGPGFDLWWFSGIEITPFSYTNRTGQAIEIYLCDSDACLPPTPHENKVRFIWRPDEELRYLSIPS